MSSEDEPSKDEPSSESEPSSEGPGRPPKPPEERRTESHGLRLSPAEKAELRRRAEDAGVSINEYIRRSTIGGEPLQSAADRKAIRHIAAIGSDLHQLTKAAEEGKIDRVEGLEETLATVRDAIDRL